MHRVIRSAEQSSSVPVVTSLGDVFNGFDESTHDLDADTSAAISADGEIVAFIWTSLSPNPTRERAVNIHGAVHAAWTRQGLGNELIRWAVDRGRERLAVYPDDLPKLLRAHMYEEDTATVAAYVGCGFLPTRYFVEMERDLGLPIAQAQLPPELVLETWSQGIDETTRDAHNDAFRDHWASEPLTEERWRRWISGGEHFLPACSYVVSDSAGVVGFAMNSAYPDEWEELGHSAAWIQSLGTRRAWRHRGVASALISASLLGFAGRGLERAWLGVDTESPTGALALYQHHGFKTRRQEVSYEIGVGSQEAER